MINTYPHMCRDGHQEIGHRDSEHEMCPLCKAEAEIARLRAGMGVVEQELLNLGTMGGFYEAQMCRWADRLKALRGTEQP